jgi:tRNA A37 threonylcarbamoyladenosine biosynthesis protein TsaE
LYDCSRFTKSLRNIALEQFNYVAFEGNIGAGKTTLAKKFLRILMQNSLGTFCGQSFYLNFIKIKTDTRFHLKCHFMDRYQQLSDDLAQFDLFKDFLVADYHILNL